jgi:hypothetical protein
MCQSFPDSLRWSNFTALLASYSSSGDVQALRRTLIVLEKTQLTPATMSVNLQRLVVNSFRNAGCTDDVVRFEKLFSNNSPRVRSARVSVDSVMERMRTL